MDYRYLKAFETTARLKSFTLAAKELGIGQSAVSRQVKLLEQDLKVDLLFRSSKSVELSKKGEELLQWLGHFEQGIGEIFQNQRPQTIRIGILQGLLEQCFHSVVEEYYSHAGRHQGQRHLNNLEICVADEVELRIMIDKGEVDFAFLVEEIQNEKITSIRLFQEEFFIVSAMKIDPHKLEHYRWITYSADDHLYKISRKKSQQIICVNSVHSVLDLVRRGVGIAVLSEIVIPEEAKIGKDKIYCYPVNERKGGRTYIYLSMQNYKIFPYHLREMLELIKKYFKE